MKTNILLYTLVVSLVTLSACDDYLKDDSGDLMIPQSVGEFQPLLYGEAYPVNYNREAGWINLQTDDVELGPMTGSLLMPERYNSNVGEGKLAYTWQEDIDEKITDTYWTKRYNNILACNLVVEALPTMVYSENEVGKYHFVAAQAYALRAYNYFCLVNTYALPYSSENLSKDGVILRLDPGVSVATMKMPRATIGAVYDQIVKDLENANNHMEQASTANNKHLLSREAVQLLTTRVALFMEDWSQVITTGEAFLKANSNIYDLNNIAVSDMGNTSGDDVFFMFDIDKNKEIVFTFGNDYGNIDYFAFTASGKFGFRSSYRKQSSIIQAYKMPFQPKDPENDPDGPPQWVYDDADNDIFITEIENELDEEVYDLRLRAYFERTNVSKSDYNYYLPIKFNQISGFVYQSFRECWRSVEVVLNVAEAYARQANGISNDALKLINRLRKNRIRTDMYEELTASHFSSKDELIRFIWQERRRELCFEENHRFWDLRRQGMPRLYHRWSDLENAQSTYMLPAKSNNYVMAIPRSEYVSNDLIENNPRDIIQSASY